ncbi:unnamed protein product, partial [Choristocarpus tenellus]
YVKARVLAWDIYRNWDLWVERCCPAEEERLRLRGRTFEDPEQHIDQHVCLAPQDDPKQKWAMEEAEETSTVPPLDEPYLQQRMKEGGSDKPEGKAEKESSPEDFVDDFQSEILLSAGDVVRARRQWALRRTRRKEGPNRANQKQLGGTDKVKAQESGGLGSILSMLVEMCFETDDWEVVKASAAALSVAAYLYDNADRMGQCSRCVLALVNLLSNPDVEIQAYAAATLTNLGQGSRVNQEVIGEAGGVEALLLVCQGRASDRAAAAGGPPLSPKLDPYGHKEGKEGGKDNGGSDLGRAVTEDGGERMDVDALEAATAALANLMCLHEGNTVRLVDAGGIGVLVGLVSSFRATNLLDSDQVEEIHANAAEALANATRNYGDACAARIHALGVGPIILLCGSRNLQARIVRRHAALVLGNISQHEDHRSIIGQEGAVEALFALCESNDDMVCANALWALGNLAWNPFNQERIGRYMTDLFYLTSSVWLPVQTNALTCLANALYYHDDNRRRIQEEDGALPALIRFCCEDNSKPIQEAALRCMVSLTYVDHIEASLAELGCVPILVSRLSSPSDEIRRLAALTIHNMALHDDHKKSIVDAGAVEAAVMLIGTDDHEIRNLATKILEALNTTGTEDKSVRKELGTRELLGMLSMEDNISGQKLAAEALAEEAYLTKQSEVGELGGIDVLLGICNKETEVQLMIPVLWGLRNCLNNHKGNKDRLIKGGGLEVVI